MQVARSQVFCANSAFLISFSWAVVFLLGSPFELVFVLLVEYCSVELVMRCLLLEVWSFTRYAWRNRLQSAGRKYFQSDTIDAFLVI
jgi:hypothetical protein